MKVLYGDEERTIVVQAAELAGLRPSSFVAVAALRLAQRQLAESGDQPRSDQADGDVNWSGVEDRDVLAELIQARLALRRFSADVDRAVSGALHNGQEPPLWLAAAVAAAERAVAQVDAAAAVVARRLG